MRIYTDVLSAVREVERDLFEMGIEVHPQTMQNKQVADDPAYRTKELQEYAFQIIDPHPSRLEEENVVEYCLHGKTNLDPSKHADVGAVMDYMDLEFIDRTSRVGMNPGNSYKARLDVWSQFLHNGKFHYTYSERLAPQWDRFFQELTVRPDTRQAILNLHSNICPVQMSEMVEDDDPNRVELSMDSRNMGGTGRIPCSLYYQAILRMGKIHWSYGMRSCDFVTHFAVDILLAMRLQRYVAKELNKDIGMFTYHTGSLHAYAKDLTNRGIF